MKKKVLFIFLIIFILFPVVIMGFDLSAASAALYEPVSGRFLFEKSKDVKMGIASTTKILTAITAIENGNPADVVITSKSASEIEGSSIWLEEGEEQTLENLLYGLMLASGNDASVAIAEHIGKDVENFAILMNQTAKRSGADQSNFVNPSGLDHESHYATAADLAKIMAYAEKNPLFRKITSTKQYEIPWKGHPYNRVIHNHNKLLTLYEGCSGGKTGFTKKSGRCLVSSATRDGIHLIAVTLNAPDDWNDHIKLMDYGFSILQRKDLLQENLTAEDYVVKNGEKNFVKTSYKNTVSIPVLDSDCVTFKTIWSKNNTAPIEKGAVVGYREFYLNGEMITKADIVSKESCDVKIVPKLQDFLLMLFGQLF